MVAKVAKATDKPVVKKVESFKTQYSYCLGMFMGMQLKQGGVDVDETSFVEGFQCSIVGSKPKMSQAEVGIVMAKFDAMLKAKAKKKADTWIVTNKAYLDANKAKEGIQITKSGLQYKIIRAGTGAIPKATDTVKVHYRGTLVDGEVFDSSYKRGQPAEFPVTGVIQGWTEALQLMKTGAKWQLVIPSELAYGPRGAGGAIGPNATLMFDVELLEIVKPAAPEAKEAAAPAAPAPAEPKK